MRWTRFVPNLTVVWATALVVGPVLAQGNPADLRVNEAKKQADSYQPLKGFSGYGAYLGGMRVFAGPLGKAQVKPVMQGVFRYQFNENWIGMGEFGFGWNSFKDKADTVLTFTMGTLGAGRRVGNFARSDIRFTFGGGFYRWNYKWHGNSIRDMKTWRYYRGFSPGGFVGLEAERRIAKHVTLVGALQQHYVLTSDSQKFGSLFDRNYPYFNFRLGLNYHFSPYEGMLWERKESRKIRLESGKEGK